MRLRVLRPKADGSTVGHPVKTSDESLRPRTVDGTQLMRVRLLAAVPLALLSLSAAAQPAQASPVASPRSALDPVTCEGLGQVVVVATPGAGRFPASFVLGGTTVLVPYAYEVTLAVDGDAPVIVAAARKPAQDPGDLTVCTFTHTFMDGGATVTISGTVSVALHGGGSTQGR